MREHTGGHDLLLDLVALPAENAPSINVLLEELDLECVLAGFQVDVSGDFFHSVGAAIVEHLFVVNEQPRTVVGFEIESVFPVCRNLDEAGPANVEELLELGMDEARAIALAIAGLPPTAKAVAKSKQAAQSRVYPITNQRTPAKLVWLN